MAFAASAESGRPPCQRRETLSRDAHFLSPVSAITAAFARRNVACSATDAARVATPSLGPRHFVRAMNHARCRSPAQCSLRSAPAAAGPKPVVSLANARRCQRGPGESPFGGTRRAPHAVETETNFSFSRSGLLAIHGFVYSNKAGDVYSDSQNLAGGYCRLGSRVTANNSFLGCRMKGSSRRGLLVRPRGISCV